MLGIFFFALKFLLCFFFILFIILIIPVKYILDIKIYNGVKIYFCLSYFFGLIKFEYKDRGKNKLKLSGFNLIKNTGAKNENESDFKNNISEKISKLNKKKSSDQNNFNYDDIKSLLSPTLEFIKDIIKKVHPKKIIINGQIGFDNPAYTGYFSVVENFICPLVNIKPNIKYDFQHKIFNLHFLFGGQTLTLLFIFIVIKYIRNEHVFSFVKSNFISKEVY